MSDAGRAWTAPAGVPTPRLAAVIGLACLMLVIGCGPRDESGSSPSRWDLGRPATSEQIALLGQNVSPSGVGLPAGSGTAAQGAPLYTQQCSGCHGPAGEGTALAPKLIGREPRVGFPFGTDPTLVRTIGNYWPYATTVYDYINRAMPQNAPGSLAPNQIYAITAFLLARNEVIPDSLVLDAHSLPLVRMPARDRFVVDDRRGGREIR